MQEYKLIRVRADLYKKMQELAKLDKRSLTKFLEVWIEDCIAFMEKPE